MEDISVSKFHKKQLINLGFRHSEAKCLLMCMNRVDVFKHYLRDEIDEHTIFHMHDAIFAKRFEIIRPKKYKYKFDYLPLFRMVSHKTKKILRSWLNKFHNNRICKCIFCYVFNTFKKLSEYNTTYYRETIIKLPNVYISRIMYLFSRYRKYSIMDSEYIIYLILFKIELFNKDITNVFSNEHKNYFYCNIETYLHNERMLDLFDSLVISNNYLPPELLTNIHKFVLSI